MIFIESLLNIKDNSGPTKSKCIKILNKSKKKAGSIGDLIIVSIQKIKTTKKFFKGDISKAFIIRTKKNFLRSDGSFIKFDDNTVVLVDNKYNPFASRIKGPIIQEFKKHKKYEKILSAFNFIV